MQRSRAGSDKEERVRTEGARVLAQCIKDSGLSISRWCEEQGFDRVQIQRILSGERGHRVSVDLAVSLELATGGVAAVRLFCSSTSRPVKRAPRRRVA